MVEWPIVPRYCVQFFVVASWRSVVKMSFNPLQLPCTRIIFIGFELFLYGISTAGFDPNCKIDPNRLSEPPHSLSGTYFEQLLWLWKLYSEKSDHLTNVALHEDTYMSLLRMHGVEILLLPTCPKRIPITISTPNVANASVFTFVK